VKAGDFWTGTRDNQADCFTALTVDGAHENPDGKATVSVTAPTGAGPSEAALAAASGGGGVTGELGKGDDSNDRTALRVASDAKSKNKFSYCFHCVSFLFSFFVRLGL